MRTISFALSRAQQDLAALVRAITRAQLTAERRQVVEAAAPRFDRALWRAFADADVLSAALPSSVGGADLDLLEQCSILNELGRAVAPVPYLTHITSMSTIAYFGTDAQRARWAEPAAAGSLVVTAALTEDHGDPERPLTAGQREGSHWVLDGAKAVVPFGTAADAFLVQASTPDGPALFVVLPSDDGIFVDAERIFDGDEEASLILNRVRLDADRFVAGGDVGHWLVARPDAHRGLRLPARGAGTRPRTERRVRAHARAVRPPDKDRSKPWRSAWPTPTSMSRASV